MQDPSINRARKTLLGETAEQVFQIGDMELPLLVPAYAATSACYRCTGALKNCTQAKYLHVGADRAESLGILGGSFQVLDYQRFSMMVEAGAGTVSDIVWQL